MKTVFIGTVRSIHLMLKKMIDLGYPPVGVITREAATYNTDFVSLKPLCHTHKIPCRLVTDIHEPKVIDWITKNNRVSYSVSVFHQ